MSIELITLAANLNFVCFSKYLQDINGQIFSFFVLSVVAAEAAIGLAIVVVYYRNCGSIHLNKMNRLKG
jgi:NADH-quinone oxidoreductase subunit K